METKVKTPGKTDDVVHMDGGKLSAFYMEGQLHDSGALLNAGQSNKTIEREFVIEVTLCKDVEE